LNEFIQYVINIVYKGECILKYVSELSEYWISWKIVRERMQIEWQKKDMRVSWTNKPKKIDKQWI